MWEETWKTLSLCVLQGVRCSSVVANSAWLCSRQSWAQTPAPALTLVSCGFIFCRMGVKASALYSCCRD